MKGKLEENMTNKEYNLQLCFSFATDLFNTENMQQFSIIVNKAEIP